MRRPRQALLAASGCALLLACEPGPADTDPPQQTAPEVRPEPTTPGPPPVVRPGASAGRPRLRGPRRAAPAVAGAAAMRENEHPDEPVRVLVRRLPTGLAAPATTRPVFHGLLHAHTMISDGSGTPEEAFVRARERGVDFMAITPHNHSLAEAGASADRRDGVLIADTPELYQGPSPVTVTPATTGQDLTLDSLQDAAGSQATPEFVTLFGQEFSTISSGNHVNVLGEPTVLTIGSGEYRTLYETLDARVAAGGAAPVVQMNHPDIHADLFYAGSDPDKLRKMSNDYGFDEYQEDFAALVAAADPYLVLAELLSGPAMLEEPRASHHYSGKRVHDEDYYFYLVQGFHLSPSVGHDNHFRTWGDATPARMGVLADALSEEAILGAMRANRTFASEDSDLEVELRANGVGMGGVVTLAEGEPLTLELEVRDPTDPDTPYEVDLFYGDVQAQDASGLIEWKPADGLVHAMAFDGNGTVTVDLFLASGLPEFFYARLQQGDDDRAWTAPVWINHPRSYDVD